MSASLTFHDQAKGASDPRRVTLLVRAWLAVVVLGVVGAVAVWVRLPAAARDVLWAEDGTRFIADALYPGPWKTLFVPYGGYLQFIPRVGSDLVTRLLPVSSWALGVTAAAAIATGATCVLVYACSAEVVTWAPARIGISLAPALLPMGVWEITGTLNNVHSVLLCAAPWLLLYRPRSRRSAIVLAVVACAITLSEPEAAYFVPLMLWRVRDLRSWVVRAGYLVGLAAQLIAFLTSPRPLAVGIWSARSTVKGFFANVVLGAAFPSPSRVGALMAHHLHLVYAIALPIAAAVAVTVVLGRAIERVAVVALLAGSLAVWTAGFNLNLTSGLYRFNLFTPGDWARYSTLLRYGFAPGVFLIAVVLLAASVLARRGRLSVISWAVLVLVALALVTGSTTSATPRSAGPSWRSGVATATAVCSSHPGRWAAAVPGAPAPIWMTVVPCSRLR